MDTQSLAMEMAPVIIWQKGRAPELYKKYWNKPSEGLSKKNSDPEPTYSAWDMLSGECFITYSQGSKSKNLKEELVFL